MILGDVLDFLESSRILFCFMRNFKNFKLESYNFKKKHIGGNFTINHVVGVLILRAFW